MAEIFRKGVAIIFSYRGGKEKFKKDVTNYVKWCIINICIHINTDWSDLQWKKKNSI